MASAPTLHYMSFSAATDGRLQTTTNFGLIAGPYDSDSSIPDSQALTQWQRFEHEIQTLNDDAPAGTSYKLLFLGRHGEGYHNVAERFYGTEAWNVRTSLPFSTA